MTLTGLAFMALFFSACAMAFARHPVYGLVAYVATFYLHPPSRWWGASLPDLRWSLLAAGVTLLALIVSKKTVAPTIPLFKHKLMPWLVVLVIWLGLQQFWALVPVMHMELFTMYAKYALLVGLIYRCLDSREHLRLFLWTHVLGCAYLGWIAFTEYEGGRFEGFGGPGIAEANAGALQVVTGMFVAASLFLAGKLGEKIGTAGCMPFILNALVTTISRSGFLAAGSGGLIFNLFTPTRLRRRVRVISVLGVVLFALLTNPIYWMRIQSIQEMGTEVEGVDTGSGRLVLMQQQLRMFADHPFGCGHRCTVALSPQYLDLQYLTGTDPDHLGRSSHNTFMSLLVEQGLPGALMYVLLLLWIFACVRSLKRHYRNDEGFEAMLFPAVASILGAITLGDMFVDYLKSEVRLWFLAVLMVLMNLAARERKAAETSASQTDLSKQKPGGNAIEERKVASGAAGSRAGPPVKPRAPLRRGP